MYIAAVLSAFRYWLILLFTALYLGKLFYNNQLFAYIYFRRTILLLAIPTRMINKDQFIEYFIHKSSFGCSYDVRVLHF